MPSRDATRRASSTVAGEQQLPKRVLASCASAHGHTRSVTPTTSKPCSTRRAAATDESTPPLSPTTIRSATSGPLGVAETLGAHRRDELGQPIQLLARGVRDLDAPGAIVADEPDSRRQSRAQRVLDGGKLGRAPDRAAGRRAPLALDVGLGGADRP